MRTYAAALTPPPLSRVRDAYESAETPSPSVCTYFMDDSLSNILTSF